MPWAEDIAAVIVSRISPMPTNGTEVETMIVRALHSERADRSKETRDLAGAISRANEDLSRMSRRLVDTTRGVERRYSPGRGSR